MLNQVYKAKINQNCVATYVWTVTGNSLGLLLIPDKEEVVVQLNTDLYVSGQATLHCQVSCANCVATTSHVITYITV